jgi:PilZ domain
MAENRQLTARFVLGSREFERWTGTCELLLQDTIMALTSESPAAAPTLLGLSRQRRQSARRPYHATVEVVQPAEGQGVTLNVSDGGLRMAVDVDLPQGEVCLFYIREPGGEPELQRARVAWSREVSDGWIVGLQILGLH